MIGSVITIRRLVIQWIDASLVDSIYDLFTELKSKKSGGGSTSRMVANVSDL